MDTTTNTEGSTLYELFYSDKYFKHIKLYKKNKQNDILKKIASLLDEIAKDPTSGTGNPEPLKHYGEADVWSRRITPKHRLVYQILEEIKQVYILAAYGHYKDKS